MIIETPIETERLILKALDPERIEQTYVDWLNDERVNRYLEIHFVRQDLASVSDYVRRQNTSPNALLLGIHVKEGGGVRHIGNIAFSAIAWPHRRGIMGIVIGEVGEWGKGYAPEAIRALTAYAHQTMGLYKVMAGVYSTNAGSYNAFVKAGFVEDGVLHGNSITVDGRVDDILLAHFSKVDAGLIGQS